MSIHYRRVIGNDASDSTEEKKRSSQCLGQHRRDGIRGKKEKKEKHKQARNMFHRPPEFFGDIPIII